MVSDGVGPGDSEKAGWLQLPAGWAVASGPATYQLLLCPSINSLDLPALQLLDRIKEAGCTPYLSITR